MLTLLCHLSILWRASNKDKLIAVASAHKMESETPILDSIPYETILKYYNTALETGLLDTVLHPFDYAETLIRVQFSLC